MALFSPLKDASFKLPKLPALRAEVAAAAALATPCLYPAFSFVLSNSSEKGANPASSSWPGLGLMTMSAIISRDYPVIMGVCLLSAIVVLIANLITDILYALVDPTITFE